MPEHEAEQFRACGVCGRTILKGERAADYLTTDGATEPVCALCRPRAEEAGWIRADSPQAQTAPEPARRRRSLRGLRLRQRAARSGLRIRRPRPAAEPEPEADAEPPHEAQPKETGTSEPSEPVSAEPVRTEPVPADTPERRIGDAVERFNASDQPRVVAGLTRSLGQPQAAVRELDSDPPRLEVTVAWDLSWYRWEVGVNGDDAPKRVAQGDELEELGEEEIDWNATVDEEGRLRWRNGS